MPEPLKDSLNRGTLRTIADNVGQVFPAFRRRAFLSRAGRGLDAMELKARVHHIAAALQDVLPEEPLAAMDVLVEAAEHWTRGSADRYGFAGWPLTELVGELGRGHPSAGLEALRRTTHLFTGEFAIRAFLEDDLQGTMRTLRKWTRDPSHHVRRLASEGTRPRLPWAKKVPALIEDPAPGLAILEHLKDDPSETVRRSVANHLNDIAKDHPDVVTDTCARWWSASRERQALIRHGLRTLVKRGNPAALAILGFDPRVKIAIENLAVAPATLRLGGSLLLSCDIVSKSRSAVSLVVDYAVHHVKKSGKRSAKTFKLKTLTLDGRATEHIEKRHAIKPISTRTYHSGRHAVELLVNGRSRGMVEFDLVV